MLDQIAVYLKMEAESKVRSALLHTLLAVFPDVFSRFVSLDVRNGGTQWNKCHGLSFSADSLGNRETADALSNHETA